MSVLRRYLKTAWSTLDPDALSGSSPGAIQNLLNGKWVSTSDSLTLPDPLTGSPFLSTPNTSISESEPFASSARSIPKSGLHNPYKNVPRYKLYGAVCEKVASELHKPEVFSFFLRLIQRTVPKSDEQAFGELAVVRAFFENFGGDQVRFLARGFSVPGDRDGQQSHGYRWPYGPVAIISPFNFPLEIPILQMMGALFMGNHVTMKPDFRVAACVEQFIRFLHHCGMPLTDVNLINGHGQAIEQMIRQETFRMIQFTGSSKIANHLAQISKGKIKIEDAGFDWKILGPDVSDIDYVAYTSDQDAYAFSGQKCSAQSILFAHDNWVSQGFFSKLSSLASRRSLSDLTIVPVLSWDNAKIQHHVDSVLKIPGSKLLFGGPLSNHSIPKVYGSYAPTAIYVPIEEIGRNFELVTTELFGPFQIVTSWSEVGTVLQLLERMHHHLTAAVVSNEPNFLRQVLGATVNGTTYAGIRARTTGAPQNHWFGPAGDPRGAGIGTPEAIKLVWSCHREIISDNASIPKDWTTPKAS
jgi:1-pyrroline-5-carboxylate dehydrogenase